MRRIELDAKSWMKILDFYQDLLKALGAPEWHGRNLNALIDSMIWGGINELDPPYIVRIENLSLTSEEIRDHVEDVREYMSRAREEYRTQKGKDIEVEFELVP